MKIRGLSFLAAVTILLLTAFSAVAEEGKADDNRWGFNLGIGGTVSTSEYKGVERLGWLCRAGI